MPNPRARMRAAVQERYSSGIKFAIESALDEKQTDHTSDSCDGHRADLESTGSTR